MVRAAGPKGRRDKAGIADGDTLYVRGADPKAVARIKSSAAARDITLAEMLSRIVLAISDVQSLANAGVGEDGVPVLDKLDEILEQRGLTGQLV